MLGGAPPTASFPLLLWPICGNFYMIGIGDSRSLLSFGRFRLRRMRSRPMMTTAMSTRRTRPALRPKRECCDAYGNDVDPAQMRGFWIVADCAEFWSGCVRGMARRAATTANAQRVTSSSLILAWADRDFRYAPNRGSGSPLIPRS
jgi:hypothetical protein